jgi:hypothetical protein
MLEESHVARAIRSGYGSVAGDIALMPKLIRLLRTA